MNNQDLKSLLRKIVRELGDVEEHFYHWNIHAEPSSTPATQHWRLCHARSDITNLKGLVDIVRAIVRRQTNHDELCTPHELALGLLEIVCDPGLDKRTLVKSISKVTYAQVGGADLDPIEAAIQNLLNSFPGAPSHA